MNPEQIAELLNKTVDAVINKQTATQQPTGNSDEKVTGAIADLSKAVSAINTNLENLKKVAVVKEPETTESQMEKLVGIVANLTDKVNKIASGEKIEPADEPLDLSKMTKGQFLKMVAEAAKGANGEEASPDGEGKDDLKSLLKSIVTGKNADDEDGLDINLDEVEVEDRAGNKLNKKARTGRKALDDWFGKVIGDSSARHLGIDGDAADDDDDDDDE